MAAKKKSTRKSTASRGAAKRAAPKKRTSTRSASKKTSQKASKRSASSTALRGKVRSIMREFKSGTLHSRSKRGPTVRSRKQAVAIALSEAGASRGRSTRSAKKSSPKRRSR